MEDKDKRTFIYVHVTPDLLDRFKAKIKAKNPMATVSQVIRELMERYAARK